MKPKKRFWASCLDTHMKLALYEYAIIIIVVVIIIIIIIFIIIIISSSSSIIVIWRRLGDKPISEPMVVKLPTHICVTRPQLANILKQ